MKNIDDFLKVYSIDTMKNINNTKLMLFLIDLTKFVLF